MTYVDGRVRGEQEPRGERIARFLRNALVYTARIPDFQAWGNGWESLAGYVSIPFSFSRLSLLGKLGLSRRFLSDFPVRA